MMDNGWIKIHRQMLDWEWIDDPYMVAFWIRLLLTVNQKDTKRNGKTIKRGQILTSTHHLADTLGWSRNTVKRIIRDLEKSGQIKVTIDKGGTLITVCNFGRYQDRGGSIGGSTSGSIDDPPTAKCGSIDEPQEQKNGVGGSTDGSTIDPHNIRREEINTPPIIPPENGRTDGRIGYEFFGTFHNVELKPAELRKLQMDYGIEETQSAIDDLSCKLLDGTTQSVAHYATLTYWLKNRKKKPTTQPKGRDTIGSNFISD